MSASMNYSPHQTESILDLAGRLVAAAGDRHLSQSAETLGAPYADGVTTTTGTGARRRHETEECLVRGAPRIAVTAKKDRQN